MSSDDYLANELRKVALEMLELSFPIVRQYFGDIGSIDSKADGSPVTKADREVEYVMRDMIQKKFPHHGIIGEEFGSTNSDAEYTWVLDPIDGTRSFIAGSFDFGTLIGVLRNGVPVLGVIAHPITGDIVIGDNVRCTFNGNFVSVSDCSAVADSLCLTTDLKAFAKYQSALGFDDLVNRARAVRTWGNCYGYMLVARGLADAMIDPIMEKWDLLPLIPVIRGAGGIITDFYGNDPVVGSSIIAATPGIHESLISILNHRV